jgi:hypothetical protein
MVRNVAIDHYAAMNWANPNTQFRPYDQLPLAHQAIHCWCKDKGPKLAGPNWEIYGHWVHEWCDNPSKIQTDVYYLLNNEPLTM